MEISSPLPVSPMFFKHWHTDDTEVGVVLVKACFIRREDGGFKSDGTPPEFTISDEFEGEDIATSPLSYEQDIAPGKVGTDLFIKAIARSPEAKALSDWPVRIEIEDRLSYGFHVRGPSEWRRALTGCKLTAPELVNEVPLTYALAYGGSAPSNDEDAPDEIYEYNPAGIGYLTTARLSEREPFPAPQIGDIAEFIAADPTAEMSVHGTGPIAKAWLPRRGHAGTLDDAWQRERHPRMPEDYSLRFWNAAPSQMQISPPLEGTESIRITGLSHDLEPVTIPLPRVALFLQAQTADGTSETVELTLDTAYLDVTDPETTAHTLTLLWRATLIDPNRYVSGTIERRKLET